MAQRSLSDFAGDVYDPTDEFTGGDVATRRDVREHLTQKYKYASEAGARKDGPGREKSLAEMQVYADALDALKSGQDLATIKADAAVRANRAADALDAATGDVEDAKARGQQQAAEIVVDVIEGESNP